MDTGTNPQELISTIAQPSAPRRRVSKKTLGFLAAAAVTAGSIGSAALMANPSAADSPTPPTTSTETESGEIGNGAIEIDEIAPLIDLDTYVDTDLDTDEVYDWSHDDCPACGMG